MTPLSLQELLEEREQVLPLTVEPIPFTEDHFKQKKRALAQRMGKKKSA